MSEDEIGYPDLRVSYMATTPDSRPANSTWVSFWEKAKQLIWVVEYSVNSGWEVFWMSKM